MVWHHLVLRILLSGGLIVGASELAKRNSMLGALLISLPLASMLTMIWMHHDGSGAEQLTLFSKEVFWLVIPSLVFFIAFPALLTKGVAFWPAIGGSILLTAGCYWACLSFMSDGLVQA